MCRLRWNIWQINRLTDRPKEWWTDSQPLFWCLEPFVHGGNNFARHANCSQAMRTVRIPCEMFAGIFRRGFSKWPQRRPIGQREWARLVVGPLSLPDVTGFLCCRCWKDLKLLKIFLPSPPWFSEKFTNFYYPLPIIFMVIFYWT